MCWKRMTSKNFELDIIRTFSQLSRRAFNISFHSTCPNSSKTSKLVNASRLIGLIFKFLRLLLISCTSTMCERPCWNVENVLDVLNLLATSTVKYNLIVVFLSSNKHPLGNLSHFVHVRHVVILDRSDCETACNTGRTAVNTLAGQPLVGFSLFLSREWLAQIIPKRQDRLIWSRFMSETELWSRTKESISKAEFSWNICVLRGSRLDFKNTECWSIRKSHRLVIHPKGVITDMIRI